MSGCIYRKYEVFQSKDKWILDHIPLYLMAQIVQDSMSYPRTPSINYYCCYCYYYYRHYCLSSFQLVSTSFSQKNLNRSLFTSSQTIWRAPVTWLSHFFWPIIYLPTIPLFISNHMTNITRKIKLSLPFTHSSLLCIAFFFFYISYPTLQSTVLTSLSLSPFQSLLVFRTKALYSPQAILLILSSLQTHC